MRLIKELPRQGDIASIAQVSYTGPEGFGAVGDSLVQSPLLFAPGGVAYLPAAGDQLLLLPVRGSDTCVGALASTAGLSPGELRLTSAGGAVIQLCQNGDIRLNGVTITKNGEILSP